MADTVERLPFPISKRLASTVSEITARNGREIHYTLAGVPFRVFTTPDVPLTMETAPSQKNQQDTEPEAGEQTLTGWWMRSQVSWHDGAGARFTETSIGQGLRVNVTSGFWESSNIDVWSQGGLRLLKATSDAGGTSNKAVAVVPDSTVFSVVAGQTGKVVRYTNLDTGVVTTDLYVNGAVTFTHVVATDTEWFAAGDNGTVYAGPIGALTGAPKIWTLTGASVNPTRLAWAKHRLWAVNDNKIYTLNYGTPGATAATYSHPSASWRYTDLADGVGGVYFSGYGDGTSHIQRISLNTDGSVPVLSAATTLAVLPSDERALRISSLTGSLVCILTNFGCRVAAADTSGNLSYGPLFLERATELPATAKPSLTAAGRFWWVAFGDENKLWRIDSSVEIDQGLFAYASDMETAAAPVSLAVRAGRAALATVAGNVQYQHATQLCPTGYITTGRIRFRTDEKKTFCYVDLTALPLDGKVTLDVLNEADSPLTLVTYDIQGTALPVSQLPASYGPQRFMSIKLTLQPATDPSKGPVIQGVRTRALPAQKPQRIYTLPFECFDREQWSSGQTEGYDGFGLDRYTSLRAAEDNGGVCLLVNYGFPSPRAELVRIEEMKFVQLQQPDATQIDGGFGGILQVSLRTLT